MPPPLARADALVHSGLAAEGVALAHEYWRTQGATVDAFTAGQYQIVVALGNNFMGNLPASLKACFRAIEQFAVAGDAGRVARTKALLATSLVRVGSSVEALDLLTQALDEARALGDPVVEFRVLNNMGVVYQALAEHTKAIAAAKLALPLAMQAGDVHMTAHLQTQLLVYQLERAVTGGLPQPRAAVTQCDDPDAALRAAARVGPTDHLADSQASHHAAVAALRGLLEQAQAHQRACHDAGRFQMVTALARACGMAHLALDDTAEARTVLEQGLTIARGAGQWVDEVRLGIELADALARDGATLQAGELLEAAQQRAQSLHEPELLGRCHERAGALFEAAGDYAAALREFHRYHDAKVAWLQIQADARAQVMAIRLDVERTRLEGELLRGRAAELEREKQTLLEQTAQLDRRAHVDALTGLGNRHHLERCLADLLVPTAPSRPLTLAVIDVDHFKRVNDDFSHEAGDIVLRQLGALLQETCRPQDIVVRFGGEEFVVLFVGATLAQGASAAERVRGCVQDFNWDAIRPGLAVTISIGLAACTTGAPVEDALRRADDALYRAKHGGRNQVQTAQ